MSTSRKPPASESVAVLLNPLLEVIHKYNSAASAAKGQKGALQAQHIVTVEMLLETLQQLQAVLEVYQLYLLPRATEILTALIPLLVRSDSDDRCWSTAATAAVVFGCAAREMLVEVIVHLEQWKQNHSVFKSPVQLQSLTTMVNGVILYITADERNQFCTILHECVVNSSAQNEFVLSADFVKLITSLVLHCRPLPATLIQLSDQLLRKMSCHCGTSYREQCLVLQSVLGCVMHPRCLPFFKPSFVDMEAPMATRIHAPPLAISMSVHPQDSSHVTAAQPPNAFSSHVMKEVSKPAVVVDNNESNSNMVEPKDASLTEEKSLPPTLEEASQKERVEGEDDQFEVPDIIDSENEEAKACSEN